MNIINVKCFLTDSTDTDRGWEQQEEEVKFINFDFVKSITTLAQDLKHRISGSSATRVVAKKGCTLIRMTDECRGNTWMGTKYYTEESPLSLLRRVNDETLLETNNDGFISKDLL